MKIQEVILRAMAKRITWWQAAMFVTYFVSFLLASSEMAHSDPPLKLIQKIPVPGVQGRRKAEQTDERG